MQIIQSTPTNIITGFLGVGKTTAINHILASKPKEERWAVLVNEFGEIGVDASLINGQREDDRVFVREVAGGCMCCTSGLSMQVALNRLLSEAKPHRLLIEPTGLGHPREVLEVLSQPHYKSVIDLQATLTLVDARNLNDIRYTSNETFNEQLAVADIIVGNKTDKYADANKKALIGYAEKLSAKDVYFVEHGAVEWQWLQQKNNFKHNKLNNQSILFNQNTNLNNAINGDITIETVPESGFIYKENQQDDFFSAGWLFSSDFVFSRMQISVFLMGLKVERAKAVMITDEGVFGYNKTAYGMNEIPLDDAMNSRIEIICNEAGHINKEGWESELLTARSSDVGMD